MKNGELVDSALKWQEFKLGELFEKIPAKFLGKGDKFKFVSKVKTDEYCIPMVYAKFGDNGIMYWSKKGDFQTYENILSIVYNGAIAAGKVYAQKQQTGILAESYFVRLKKCNVDFEVNLFLQCVLEKVLYSKYSRENLATWSGKVEKDIISLPVQANGEIAFDFMQDFIKAVQKQSIKAVDLWSEKRINATKSIIAKP